MSTIYTKYAHITYAHLLERNRATIHINKPSAHSDKNGKKPPRYSRKVVADYFRLEKLKAAHRHVTRFTPPLSKKKGKKAKHEFVLTHPQLDPQSCYLLNAL